MKTTSEAVEGHRQPTDYLAARESLHSIGKRYAGLPPAKRAAEILKTFRNDLEIRREIQASEALAKFKDRPTRTRILRLRRFIMKYDGTLAAKRAAQRLRSKRR